MFQGNSAATETISTMGIPHLGFILMLCILSSVSRAWPSTRDAPTNSGDYGRPAMYFPSELGPLLAGMNKPASHEVTETCKCGRTQNNRIVGGTKAESGEWCWQAKVMVWSKDDDGSFFLCGGSIINDEYILSAAHCFHGHEGSKVDVYLGAYKLFGDTDGKRKFVDSILIHPDYDPVSKANDLALVKLVRKIRYSSRICSVCLPDKKINYTGETCTVTGWGALKSGGDSPEVLMEAQVKVISDDLCREEYGTLDASQICAAAPGTDSCQGDSGGPLVHKNSQGIWDLIGVVSAGRGCADPNYAGLYANVYKFLPWIYEHTKGSEYCSRK